MKKLLYSVIILAAALTMLMGCNDKPADSVQAPTADILLPEGAGDSETGNEISISLKESFTDNNLTTSFEIVSGNMALVSVNGGSADSAIEWSDECNVVLKVKVGDGALGTGKFKFSVTSSWVESGGLSKATFTHSDTDVIFYATKNGKIAYSMESEWDALEKLNDATLDHTRPITIDFVLPEGAGDSTAENEIRFLLNEGLTDSNLTTSFEIVSDDVALVSVNGGSTDTAITWNDECNTVLKVKLADGAADSGEFKITVTSSWIESGTPNASLTHSTTMGIFYATKDGKIAYSMESAADALEKLN